jgi:hypothetical protein
METSHSRNATRSLSSKQHHAVAALRAPALKPQQGIKAAVFQLGGDVVVLVFVVGG